MDALIIMRTCRLVPESSQKDISDKGRPVQTRVYKICASSLNEPREYGVQCFVA